MPFLTIKRLITKPILNYPADNLNKIWDFRAYENGTSGRCMVACQAVFYKWNEEQEVVNGTLEEEQERAYH
ncbi:hypothetical protein ES708_08020 [subsurface metagenome]